MNIYVGNLSWGLKDQDLANLFAPFGEVSSAKIVTDKFTQRSKGFGFVEMANDEEAQAAIAQLNGTEVEGRSLVVNESRPKQEGGGGGGGYKKRNFGGGVAAATTKVAGRLQQRRWRWLQSRRWRWLQQGLLIAIKYIFVIRNPLKVGRIFLLSKASYHCNGITNNAATFLVFVFFSRFFPVFVVKNFFGNTILYS